MRKMFKLLVCVSAMLTLLTAGLASASTAPEAKNEGPMVYQEKPSSPGEVSPDNEIYGDCGYSAIWATNDSFTDTLGNRHYRVRLAMGILLNHPMWQVDWSYSGGATGSGSDAIIPSDVSWNHYAYVNLSDPGAYNFYADYTAWYGFGLFDFCRSAGLVSPVYVY